MNTAMTHQRMARVRVFVAGVTALTLVTVAGCATVKVYERDRLGDPIMERTDHFAKQSLEQKFFSSREGSIGGAGGIGGGCGCAK
jgi:hypothetical protein